MSVQSWDRREVVELTNGQTHTIPTGETWVINLTPAMISGQNTTSMLINTNVESTYPPEYSGNIADNGNADLFDNIILHGGTQIEGQDNSGNTDGYIIVEAFVYESQPLPGYDGVVDVELFANESVTVPTGETWVVDFHVQTDDTYNTTSFDIERSQALYFSINPGDLCGAGSGTWLKRRKLQAGAKLTAYDNSGNTPGYMIIQGHRINDP